MMTLRARPDAMGMALAERLLIQWLCQTGSPGTLRRAFFVDAPIRAPIAFFLELGRPIVPKMHRVALLTQIPAHAPIVLAGRRAGDLIRRN
jgi:hypothetical protein